MGSPPRRRGKGAVVHHQTAAHGITPAWAGKRAWPTLFAGCTPDHPRMGGEKANGSDAPDDDEGSPPRERGKTVVPTHVFIPPRITPAWAGKRLSPVTPYNPPLDHPRVGGEKVQGMVISGSMMGSPPHGRGKAGSGHCHRASRRLTPAWAGKSYSPVSG